MSNRTVYPSWMKHSNAAKSTTWAVAPTRAQHIHADLIERDGELPNLYVLQTIRFRFIARPLLRLIDVILGGGAQPLGRTMQVGALIIQSPPESTFERDDVVAAQQERIEEQQARIHALQSERQELIQRAATAEGIGRAIARFARSIEKNDERAKEAQ